MKRFLDLLLATGALVAMVPLFVIVVPVLRLSGEGKIFFLQNRVGLHQKEFKLIKFATMLEDSPNLLNGTVTVKDDQRVLPVGRFLRKSKINELPQLWNVVTGEMSLVGPRPLTKENFAAYSESSRVKVTTVKPGLSGIGSIVFRSEEELMSGANANQNYYRSVLAQFKAVLEEWYVDNDTVYTYLGCIALTLYVVITRDQQVVWRFFNNLPKPPKELAEPLGFNQNRMKR